MRRLSIIAAAAAACLLSVPVGRCAPSELKAPDEPGRNETEVQKERSPVTQKQDPQPPPQITFPFPFFPFRPDASLTPAMPQLPFTFPFLFPSFVPRPSGSARSLDLSLPVETFVISDGEDELRKTQTPDKKKPKKKKKKKQQKKPKPMVVYQKENQVALEGIPAPIQPGIAGQFANGNQGSYTGYYMVYLVQVTWNGSNETQTIIAGRPVIAANPPPTESAQITDLSGSVITESPFKPPPTTQCFFQRSTTADLSGVGKPPIPTDHPDQEIISEELETMEEYDEEDPKKKKKKKKSKTEAPVTHPT